MVDCALMSFERKAPAFVGVVPPEWTPTLGKVLPLRDNFLSFCDTAIGSVRQADLAAGVAKCIFLQIDVCCSAMVFGKLLLTSRGLQGLGGAPP